MKKLILVFASAVMFFAISASAQSVNAGFGLGGSYPKAPDSIGFDSEVFVDVGLNKFFAVGLESGFGWIKKSSGKDIDFGSKAPPITSNDSINYYSIPLLLTATVYFPVGDYESALKPYISGGAGYSWTTFSASGVFNQKNTTFHGFTWQALIGIDYNLGSDANNMSVFLEGGYRGTMLERKVNPYGTLELDMSGAFVKAGVSFPIVAANSY